jgi:hypothetical protein
MIRPVRRGAVFLLVLVALAAGSATVGLAESASASTSFTKAEAVAFARAVNLRASDLPGAEVIPHSFGGTIHVEGSEGAGSQGDPFSCGRNGKLNPPAGGGVSSLITHWGFVASLVLVARSEARAAAEAVALESRQGRACLARTLGEAESVEGNKKVTSFAVKAAFVPVANVLGPGAVAVHVLAELPPLIELEENLRRTPRRKPPKPKATFLHIDAAFFRVGPAEVAFLTLGTRQFPPATEGRLLALLHSRAEAHKL